MISVITADENTGRPLPFTCVKSSLPDTSSFKYAAITANAMPDAMAAGCEVL
jgi:hypothetical protein